MRGNKSLIFITVIIIIISVFHLFKKLNRYYYGIESIAKLYNIKSTGKTYYVQYFYYIGNVEHKSENQMGFLNKGKRGNFYKIVYYSKNPKNVEIFLDEPITDTTLILEAGFSIEDLKSISTN